MEWWFELLIESAQAVAMAVLVGEEPEQPEEPECPREITKQEVVAAFLQVAIAIPLI